MIGRKKQNKKPFLFNNAYAKLLREKAILFLGNKCSNPNCLVPNGCADKRCLQIDHINGRAYKEKRLSSVLLYEDILNNPQSLKIYQLLCANCNWIKRSTKKEVRGYNKNAKFIGDAPKYLLPGYPLAYLNGCINPTSSCVNCNIEGCLLRVKNKVVFGFGAVADNQKHTQKERA